MSKRNAFLIFMAMMFVAFFTGVAVDSMFWLPSQKRERNRQIDACFAQGKVPANLPNDKIACLDGDYPK
jgi:hypothetical protein